MKVKEQIRQDEQELDNNFGIAHWLASEDVPVTKYDSLCKFLRERNFPLSATHLGRTSAISMQQCMSQSLESQLANVVKTRNLPYSIIVDESTDIATTSSLVIYIRYVDDKTFTPITQFLTILTLAACNAATIAQEIKNYLNKHQYNTKLMLGFGSDGASVMTGKIKGVVQLLRQDKAFNKRLIAIHCSSHRVQLCCEDAQNDYDYVEVGDDDSNENKSDVEEQIIEQEPFVKPHFSKYRQTIMAIRKLFSKSSKRLKLLEKFQHKFELPTRRILRYAATRWLSIHTVSCRLMSQYEALFHAIKELDDEGSATTVLSNMENFDFFASTHFLTIILDPIQTLCKLTQSNDLTISALCDAITVAKQQLQFYVDKGSDIIGVMALAKQAILNETDTFVFKFQSLEFDVSQQQLSELESIFTAFVKNLIKALDNRFPDTIVYRTLSIFEFDRWALHENSQDIQTLGVEEISKLSEHFQLDKHTVLREWVLVRQAIHQRYYKDFKGRNMILDAWSRLYGHYYSSCKNIFFLLSVAMTLPLSSASCERGFSKQNYIKTRFRSKMLQPHLDSLMRISINAPLFNMIDLNEAYNFWRTRNVDVDKTNSEIIASSLTDDENPRVESESEVEGDLFVNVVRKKRKKRQQSAPRKVQIVSADDGNALPPQLESQSQSELAQSAPLPEQAPEEVNHHHLTRRVRGVNNEKLKDAVSVGNEAAPRYLRISKESKPTAKKKKLTVETLNDLGVVLNTYQYDETSAFWRENPAHQALYTQWRERVPVAIEATEVE